MGSRRVIHIANAGSGYCNGTFEYEGVGEPKEGKQNVWVKVDEVGGKPSLYRGE